MIKDIFYGKQITNGTEIMSLYHLHKTCTGDFAVNSNIFWRGLDCWWPLRFNWFLCSSAHTSSETSQCKHFWRRLDQRQWKEVVAQLNGRKPEPGTGPGLATVCWCTHTAARRRHPVIAGQVVLGILPVFLNVRVFKMSQGPNAFMTLAA